MSAVPEPRPSRPAAEGLEREAAAWLASPVQSVTVWPGCVHVLSRAEVAVTATPAFQRLRRLRQMGLAHHAWPNAENTRASHSLGVAYWSAAYLEALGRADDARTRQAMTRVQDELGGLCPALVLRLFALLHDIDLLPLGHTLRYQSGAFAEAPGRPRLFACVAQIRQHAREYAFQEAPTPSERQGLIVGFERHLDAAAAALASEGHNGLVEQIVNSGLGADLFDFALRDSFAIGRVQPLHLKMLEGLRLTPGPSGPQLALDARDPSSAAERIAMAEDLYRARFEVFAASVFHPVKLAADAMLDWILRRITDRGRLARLADAKLLDLGDDAFLALLEKEEALTAVEAQRDCVLTPALQSGRLHQEVYRTTDLARFRARPDAQQALALDPAWRSQAEAALGARLSWAEDGDLIVAVSSPKMQAKPANALFIGPGGETFALAEAAAHGSPRQEASGSAYASLWSLRIYLAPAKARLAREVVHAARAAYGREG